MSDEPTLPFLCVCGTAVSTTAGQGGQCTQCGRFYSTTPLEPSLTWSFEGTTGGAIQQAEVSRANEDDAHSMDGCMLDHFRILNRLGEGGMGTVYRALDESLQRFVALKVIRKQQLVADDEDSSETHRVSRLLEEARAQARINHANVVHVYFVSRDPKRPYLAMELVPGETLAQRLKEGPLPFTQIVSIGIQVAMALGESTRLDVTHGDIKPSNILLHGQHVKLSDFGLAQRRSRKKEELRLAGTPSYMAPEVCRGEPLSAQADMYALGVTLFEMTFGRLPYSISERTLAAHFLVHQEAAVEFPESWPSHLPEDWRRLLARLLEKNPAQRFPDWDAVVAELRRLQPVPLATAGRVQRVVAWGIDYSLITFGKILTWLGIVGLFRVGRLPNTWGAFAETASYIIAPALMMLWIGSGYRSPGKSLMQLRVLDLHGLPPQRSRLAWRSVLQFLPTWMLPLELTNQQSLGPREWTIAGLIVLAWLFLFVDLLFAVFSKSCRSLHDQIFGTQVVLTHPD